MNLNEKAGRIEYGQEGEEIVHNLFNKKGLDNVWLRVGINQKSAYDNLRRGDIHLPKTNEYIDVKHTACITRKSAYGFKGDWFLIIPERNIKKAWVVSAETIRNYMDKIKDLETTISGEKCWYFNEPLYSSIPIKDFILERI